MAINNKKNGTIALLISIIILLSLMCVVSITYNFIGGFYYSRMVSFSKVLGEDETIVINGEGVYSCSFNFGGTLVLGTDIKQNIYIQNGDKETYLRAKLMLDNKDNMGMVFGLVNWVSGSDGYIYFNQAVSAREKIGLCKYIKIKDDIKLESNQNYILSVVVEATSAPYNYIIS